MNEIKIKVKFKKGLCYSQGIKLVQNDYNSTKLVFEFDDNEGTKIFELRDSDNNVILADEIVNNELILARFDEHDNAYPIFTKEGEYVYEVSLYKDNSKLTSASDKFKVNAEQVIIDGEIVETYTPMFDNLLSDLSSALQETDNIDIDVEKVGNTSTVSITKKDGTNKSVQIIDGLKGDTGDKGADAKINGVNTLSIEAGTNITLNQEGSTLTINSTGGGSSDYTDLTNKPKINNVELVGNKSLSGLGIQPAGNYALESEMIEAQNDIDHLSKVSNLFEKITATGTNITLNDTSDTIMKLNLDTTTSSQVTTTGKNLLPSTLTSQTINNVTVTRNSDGSITLNGTTNASTDFKWFEGEIQLEAGTYYIGLISTSNNFNLYSIGSNGTNIIQNPVSNQYATLTLDSNTTYTRLSSYAYSGKTFNNETFYPIICKELPVEYEMYTGGQPAPSPSYPQTIHTISGNNEIKINNKNLYHMQSATPNSSTSYTINSNNSIRVYNTSASWRSAYTELTVPAGNYAFSFQSIVTSGAKQVIIQKVIDGTATDFKTMTITNETTFTLDSETLLRFVFFSTTGTNTAGDVTYSNIQLENNTSVTSFESYKQQTYPINLGDIELCKIGDYKDVLFKNTMDSDYYNVNLQLNKWYLKKNVGKVVLDGEDTGIKVISSWDTTSLSGSYQASFSYLLTKATSTEYVILSNYFEKALLSDRNTKTNIIYTYSDGVLRIATNTSTTKADFLTWLSTHNTEVYYVLATPSYTLLNDTLQTQLDNIQYALAYDTQTNISQTNTDLPFIINAETYVKINVPTKTSDLINDSDFITSSYHDNTKQDIEDNTLTTVHKTIPTAINEVDSIAKGANQALSYVNYSAMVTAFNSLANNVYNTGQNVMIVTLQVPDLWISGIESTSSTYTYTTDEAITTALSTNGYIQVGYYKLSALETQKVDLTNYVTNTDYGSSGTAGVFRTNGTYGTTRTSSGVLYGVGKTYAEYTSSPTQLFISKGTLENVVAGKELDLKQLSTFDSTKTQVLKNINGTLTWVDES